MDSRAQRFVDDVRLVDRSQLLQRGPIFAGVVCVALSLYCVRYGNPLQAAPLCIGALFAVIADRGEPPAQRWRTMLWTTLWMTLAALIGGFAAQLNGVEVLVAAVVALVCGFVGAAGMRAALVGLLTLIVYTVNAGAPESDLQAIDSAGLVCVGALLMTAVTVLPDLILHRAALMTRDPIEIPAISRLRSRLSWDDDFVRHAARLSLAIAVASVIAHATGWQHEYWIPMSVAWMSKPNANGTVTRVHQRVAGTVAGVAVGAMLILGLSLPIWAAILLVGIAACVTSAFMWANYPTAVAGVTTFVFALFDLAHDFNGDTAVLRLAATVIAAVIVLIATRLWPPRPTQTPT